MDGLQLKFEFNNKSLYLIYMEKNHQSRDGVGDVRAISFTSQGKYLYIIVDMYIIIYA